MKTFPKPLSTKEERYYLEALRVGDLYAREMLIEHNLRLVAHIVKKYYNVEKENEDLLSVGMIGLIKAVDTFRMDKGIRLATYASCCIENEILMLLRSEKKTERDVYLSDPIGADKEGNEICLIDILEGESVDIPFQMDLRNDIKKLYNFMQRVLSKREQEILMLRYGLLGKEEQTQREIAKKMQISRSYVSRIEKKALQKLKACYEEESGYVDGTEATNNNEN